MTLKRMIDTDKIRSNHLFQRHLRPAFIFQTQENQ
jgi:hypothetical protein